MTPPPPHLDLATALPDRPIAVRPPQTIGPLSAVGLFVMLFGLLAGALWWLGPDLARDLRIGSDVAPARSLRIEEARCRSRLYVIAVCDVRYAPAAAAAETAHGTTLWYLLLGRANADGINLLASRADPELVTTDLGLDRLWQRLLALLLIVALSVTCIGLSAQIVLQGTRTRRQLMGLSGQRLRPVVVGLETSVPIAHKRRRWAYVYDDAGTERRAFIELHTSIDPLFVTPDRKRALAVSGPAGGVPLLLDAPLSALDLTQAEREAFYAACRAALEAAGEG